MSICLVRPCWIGFLVIDIVGLLSQNTCAPLIWAWPRSSKSLHIRSALQATDVAAMYSTLIDDRAVTFCFFEHQDTAPEPMLNTLPVVFFLSSMEPSQSLSTKRKRFKISSTCAHRCKGIFSSLLVDDVWLVNSWILKLHTGYIHYISRSMTQI